MLKLLIHGLFPVTLTQGSDDEMEGVLLHVAEICESDGEYGLTWAEIDACEVSSG